MPPLISVLRVPKLWFWKPLESNGMPGESLVYILSENCSVICGISKNINKLYLHLAIFWTNITLWAYYIHMAKLLHCMLVQTVIFPLCLFFHRKNSKLNLPSAHSKSKQLILITQDYGNSCWLVNHYGLLMSEKEGRVKQNSPLKNYSATKYIFFFYHGNTTLVSTAEMLHVDFLSTHKKRLNNSHNTGGLSINAKSCVAKTCNHDNRMSAK